MRFIPTAFVFATLAGVSVGCHCPPESSTRDAAPVRQARDLDAELDRFFEKWSQWFLYDYRLGIISGFTPFDEMRPEVGAVARDPAFMHELVMNWIELDLQRANKFGSGGPILMIYLLTSYEHYTGLETSVLEERMWEHWVVDNRELEYLRPAQTLPGRRRLDRKWEAVTPGFSRAEVITSDDPVGEIVKQADESDLTIIGVHRVTRRNKYFGRFTLKVVSQTQSAVRLISRRG